VPLLPEEENELEFIVNVIIHCDPDHAKVVTGFVPE
jgi:hypothetical protein